MRVQVRGAKGEVEIAGLVPAGLPALRLVQYHSPQVVLTCSDGSTVLLGDLDLNPSFSPREPLNADRAQLAKLGG